MNITTIYNVIVVLIRIHSKVLNRCKYGAYFLFKMFYDLGNFRLINNVHYDTTYKYPNGKTNDNE